MYPLELSILSILLAQAACSGSGANFGFETVTKPDESSLQRTMKPPRQPTMTTRKRLKIKKTASPRITLEEDCDYLAYYCLKAYNTGPVCGRTLHYKYQNFTNYCLLDYCNCMEKYEVWSILHMGNCNVNVNLKEGDYVHDEYLDTRFLDYIIQPEYEPKHVTSRDWYIPDYPWKNGIMPF